MLFRSLIHVVDISGIEGRDPVEDFIKINEELRKYSVKLWDRPQIIAANKSDLLFDDEVFENFKKRLNELGYDDSKIFKISAATNQGVEALMKEAARMLSTIPVTELVINDEEKFVIEEKRFTYTVEVDSQGTFVVEGSFVDRLLSAVNVNEPDSLRYFHKVLKNKGVFDTLVEKGIKDGDTVRLQNFEFEYLV